MLDWKGECIRINGGEESVELLDEGVKKRSISEDGFVVVNMGFDQETGALIYGPEVVSKGFVFETATGHLLQDAQCVILEVVEEMGSEVPDRIEKIRKKIRSSLKNYFFFTIRRRPVILPFILEL